MMSPLNFASPYRLLALSFAISMSALGVGAQISTATANASVPRRVIALDYSRVKGKHNTFFREVVGAGRAAEGLRADWQRDLALVQRECGFKYIRFHGLLSCREKETR